MNIHHIRTLRSQRRHWVGAFWCWKHHPICPTPGIFYHLTLYHSSLLSFTFLYFTSIIMFGKGFGGTVYQAFFMSFSLYCMSHCHSPIFHVIFISISFHFTSYNLHLDPQGIDDLICHGGSKISFLSRRIQDFIFCQASSWKFHPSLAKNVTF